MSAANDLIFVSIAAYRDPQLVPTIADCMAKTARPERLRFGICWQHTRKEPRLPFAADERFRIVDVNWKDSRGACWARAQCMTQWRGEEWYLQVDSHCRFVAGWDEKLLALIAQTGSAKPILSTYGSPFTPGEKELLRPDPMVIALQGFDEDGIPELKPLAVPDRHRQRGVVRSRFLGAGFLFTNGAFVEEVGYDPELYFQGEEAAMSVRAFTSGYDLFHPCETIVWHDYNRGAAKRHWDDHDGAKDVARDWGALDFKSKGKIRRLLTGEPVESYGLGQVRSLREYEEYAGLSFGLRKAQDYTRRAEEPPDPTASADWADHVYQWMARVRIDFLSLPPGSLGDASFWYVGIFDEHGIEIYRRDFPESELATLTGEEVTISLVLEFQSGTIPERWIVQPVTKTLGWLDKLQGRFAEGDYSIIVEDEAESEAAKSP